MFPPLFPLRPWPSTFTSMSATPWSETSCPPEPALTPFTHKCRNITYLPHLLPRSLPYTLAACTQAIAVLKGDSKVSGTVTFTQDDKGGPVTVTGKVSRVRVRVPKGGVEWFDCPARQQPLRPLHLMPVLPSCSTATIQLVSLCSGVAVRLLPATFLHRLCSFPSTPKPPPHLAAR